MLAILRWITWKLPLVFGGLLIAQARDHPALIYWQGRKRIEMLFAHLKRILKMGRLRLRGPCGAQDEFLLAATAQNLRKLAKLITSPAPQMIQGA